MKAPFGWGGVPSGMNWLPEKGTLKRIISDGDKEAETNCRGCGYNTTDEERKFYGQYHFTDGYSNKPIFNLRHKASREIIRQYHYCTFCVEDAWYKRRFYWAPWLQNIDYKIHAVKVKLRDRVLKSSDYLYLVVKRETFEAQHYEEIHNAPYKEDEAGNRVYNEHEAEFNSLTKSIAEYRAAPRHLYLEALEGFGGMSDEPPCTRNLTTKQKKKLLKKLKVLCA